MIAAGSPLPEYKQPWRKPAAWLYYLLAILSVVAGKLLFGVRIRRDPAIRKLRGPMIIIGNHPCYLDPFFMAAALFPRRINFLTTNKFFRSRLVSGGLRKLGALPKTQFRSDMQAMKNMLGVIRRKGVLAIYPEGQRSLDGCRQPIDEALAKLIWKVRCPVVTVIENGAYLTWPRWSKSGIRPGHIDIQTRLLFTPAQLADMDVPGIQDMIREALDYQEYDWQRANLRRFRSRSPAEGLHNVCHKCPSCGRDLAMQSNGDRLTCRFCANSGRMDKFGFIQPAGEKDRVWPDICQWHHWQMSEMVRQFSQPDFKLEFRARLEYPSDDGTSQPGGSGLLSMQNKDLNFYGDDPAAGQAPLRLRFPVGNKMGVSADYGRHFELVQADRNNQFILDEGQAVIMLVDAIQAIAGMNV